uniref:Uncharacterized protein n=1 Tax=Cacopsylla melanoneura TaxID=428564 RepID=A0A8D9AZL4_9HEMI
MDSIFLLPGSLTTTVSPRWNFISLLSLPRTIFSPSLHFLPPPHSSFSLSSFSFLFPSLLFVIPPPPHFLSPRSHSHSLPYISFPFGLLTTFPRDINFIAK